MIRIDGSFGEGGGQILRSSLSLSLVTGTPVTLEKIRAGRGKPGLMRQHMTAVKAAAEIGGAEVSGNEPGSQNLVFKPHRIKAGSYRFAVGSAGSCTLILQTILPALIMADGPSEVELEGGTHNMMAPPFDFLKRTFLPLLERISGASISFELARHGFYPAGGGLVKVCVKPSSTKAVDELSLLERGRILRREGVAMVSKLSNDIAKRELKKLQEILGWEESEMRLARVTDSPGPGNVVMAEVSSECGVTKIVSSFGKIGIPAEKVAADAAEQIQAYINANVPVGRHLADQLLLPMALWGGGEFRTMPLTPHATTNLHVIKKFLDISAGIVEEQDGAVKVRIKQVRS
ncbi:MAG: RNA 3'-terminal phosphate cyclase [Candidatus Lindowbacteria bacterium]|nr:RNA 3'-terminal phosphate cyclase [Candidatus Lindowbacteria bacterium]